MILVTQPSAGISHRFPNPEAFQSWLAHHPQSAGVLRVVNVGLCSDRSGASQTSPPERSVERPEGVSA